MSFKNPQVMDKDRIDTPRLKSVATLALHKMHDKPFFFDAEN